MHVIHYNSYHDDKNWIFFREYIKNISQTKLLLFYFFSWINIPEIFEKHFFSSRSKRGHNLLCNGLLSYTQFVLRLFIIWVTRNPMFFFSLFFLPSRTKAWKSLSENYSTIVINIKLWFLYVLFYITVEQI
jgi:hypothetical protein